MGDHDENITCRRTVEMVGEAARNRSAIPPSRIYKGSGRDRARPKGMIIADTKFEFGLTNGTLVLMDEVLTPTARATGPWRLRGRTWPRGRTLQLRQAVRARLAGAGRSQQQGAWDKEEAPARLQGEVIDRTAAKYREALDRLTA